MENAIQNTECILGSSRTGEDRDVVRKEINETHTPTHPHTRTYKMQHTHYLSHQYSQLQRMILLLKSLILDFQDTTRPTMGL